jgi:hypothetical protein
LCPIPVSLGSQLFRSCYHHETVRKLANAERRGWT